MARYKVSLKDKDTIDTIKWLRNNLPNENWDTTFDEGDSGLITFHFSNKDDLTKFILTWL